jgi:hypothetical protein
MSRRGNLHLVGAAPPRRRKRWTIQRATGLGVVAALAAILLRLLYPGWPLLRPPFAAACAIAAFCGLSILWINAVDHYRHRQRGSRMVPLRIFDVVLGLFLAVPSIWAIQDFEVTL